MVNNKSVKLKFQSQPLLPRSSKKGQGLRSFVAATLASVYFLTNVAGLHAQENSFWATRRASNKNLPFRGGGAEEIPSRADALFAKLPEAASFGLGAPASRAAPPPGPLFMESMSDKDWLAQLVLPHGWVNSFSLSSRPDAPLVIHIQDAHGIEETQRHIAAMIGSLTSGTGGSLVGVEGASGGFTFDTFRNKEDLPITRDIGEYLLKKGLIAGPEFAGITLEKPPLLYGVEDPRLYEGNLAALRTAKAYKGVGLSAVGALRKDAEGLKHTTFSRELLLLVRHSAAFKSGKEGLGPYLRHLTQTYRRYISSGPRYGRGERGDSPSFSNVQLLLSAYEKEESLDFASVETDRQRLGQEIVKTLPQASLKALLDKSVLYRTGRIGAGEYHATLLRFCKDQGIDLGQFGHLTRYIGYILVAEKIDRQGLMEEIALLETKVRDSLLTTPQQTVLMAIFRDIDLLEKLFKHEMAKPDWAEYQNRRADILTLPKRVASLRMGMDTGLPYTAADLKPFEDFCSLALQRNAPLVSNLLGQMSSLKAKTAVLVAGGFHTDDLTQLLRKQDVSYVVVTPKINEVPKESAYLDVLARDPLPLDRLLAGDRIFLSKPLNLADNSKAPLRALAAALLTSTKKDGQQTPIRGTPFAVTGDPSKDKRAVTINLGKRVLYLVRVSRAKTGVLNAANSLLARGKRIFAFTKRSTAVPSADQNRRPWISPPLAIPGVVPLVMRTMDRLGRLFPGMSWNRISTQERLDRTIGYYAPLVETPLVAIFYGGLLWGLGQYGNLSLSTILSAFIVTIVLFTSLHRDYFIWSNNQWLVVSPEKGLIYALGDNGWEKIGDQETHPYLFLGTERLLILGGSYLAHAPLLIGATIDAISWVGLLSVLGSGGAHILYNLVGPFYFESPPMAIPGPIPPGPSETHTELEKRVAELEQRAAAAVNTFGYTRLAYELSQARFRLRAMESQQRLSNWKNPSSPELREQFKKALFSYYEGTPESPLRTRPLGEGASAGTIFAVEINGKEYAVKRDPSPRLFDEGVALAALEGRPGTQRLVDYGVVENLFGRPQAYMVTEVGPGRSLTSLPIADRLSTISQTHVRQVFQTLLSLPAGVQWDPRPSNALYAKENGLTLLDFTSPASGNPPIRSSAETLQDMAEVLWSPRDPPVRLASLKTEGSNVPTAQAQRIVDLIAESVQGQYPREAEDLKAWFAAGTESAPRAPPPDSFEVVKGKIAAGGTANIEIVCGNNGHRSVSLALLLKMAAGMAGKNLEVTSSGTGADTSPRDADFIQMHVKSIDSALARLQNETDSDKKAFLLALYAKARETLSLPNPIPAARHWVDAAKQTPDLAISVIDPNNDFVGDMIFNQGASLNKLNAAGLPLKNELGDLHHIEQGLLTLLPKMGIPLTPLTPPFLGPVSDPASGPAATIPGLVWLIGKLYGLNPNIPSDLNILISEKAPVVETAVFGVFYFASLILLAQFTNIDLSFLNAAYLFGGLNLLFGAAHQGVYRFAPTRDGRVPGRWVLDPDPSWRVRVNLAVRAAAIHSPMLLGFAVPGLGPLLAGAGAGVSVLAHSVHNDVALRKGWAALTAGAAAPQTSPNKERSAVNALLSEALTLPGNDPKEMENRLQHFSSFELAVRINRLMQTRMDIFQALSSDLYKAEILREWVSTVLADINQQILEALQQKPRPDAARIEAALLEASPYLKMLTDVGGNLPLVQSNRFKEFLNMLATHPGIGAPLRQATVLQISKASEAATPFILEIIWAHFQSEVALFKTGDSKRVEIFHQYTVDPLSKLAHLPSPVKIFDGNTQKDVLRYLLALIKVRGSVPSNQADAGVTEQALKEIISNKATHPLVRMQAIRQSLALIKTKSPPGKGAPAEWVQVSRALLTETAKPGTFIEDAFKDPWFSDDVAKDILLATLIYLQAHVGLRPEAFMAVAKQIEGVRLLSHAPPDVAPFVYSQEEFVGPSAGAEFLLTATHELFEAMMKTGQTPQGESAESPSVRDTSEIFLANLAAFGVRQFLAQEVPDSVKSVADLAGDRRWRHSPVGARALARDQLAAFSPAIRESPVSPLLFASHGLAQLDSPVMAGSNWPNAFLILLKAFFPTTNAPPADSLFPPNAIVPQRTIEDLMRPEAIFPLGPSADSSLVMLNAGTHRFPIEGEAAGPKRELAIQLTKEASGPTVFVETTGNQVRLLLQNSHWPLDHRKREVPFLFADNAPRPHAEIGRTDFYPTQEPTTLAYDLFPSHIGFVWDAQARELIVHTPFDTEMYVTPGPVVEDLKKIIRARLTLMASQADRRRMPDIFPSDWTLFLKRMISGEYHSIVSSNDPQATVAEPGADESQSIPFSVSLARKGSDYRVRVRGANEYLPLEYTLPTPWVSEAWTAGRTIRDQTARNQSSRQTERDRELAPVRKALWVADAERSITIQTILDYFSKGSLGIEKGLQGEIDAAYALRNYEKRPLIKGGLNSSVEIPFGELEGDFRNGGIYVDLWNVDSANQHEQPRNLGEFGRLARYRIHLFKSGEDLVLHDALNEIVHRVPLSQLALDINPNGKTVGRMARDGPDFGFSGLEGISEGRFISRKHFQLHVNREGYLTIAALSETAEGAVLRPRSPREPSVGLPAPVVFKSQTATRSKSDDPAENEDYSFSVSAGNGIQVSGLFDGMGGYNNGHEASTEAGNVIKDYLTNAVSLGGLGSEDEIQRLLLQALDAANRALLAHRYGEGKNVMDDRGTTAIVVISIPVSGKAVHYMAAVGDSRAYLKRGASLIPLTIDDFVGTAFINPLDPSFQEGGAMQRQTQVASTLLRQDVPSPLLPMWDHRNLLRNVLGGPDNELIDDKVTPVNAGFYRFSTSPGESLIAVSDGVSDNLTLNEINAYLTDGNGDPQSLVDGAYKRSRESNKRADKVLPGRAKKDDITVLSIETPATPQGPQSGVAATVPGLVPHIQGLISTLNVAFGWRLQSDQDTVIRFYAPFLESFLFGAVTIGFNALMASLLPAMGLEPGIYSALGILSFMSVVFGFIHTQVFRFDQETGAWKVEPASLATRAGLAVRGLAIHSPLLVGALDPLLGPLALMGGNLVAVMFSGFLHRVHNNWLAPRYGLTALAIPGGVGPIKTTPPSFAALVQSLTAGDWMGSRLTLFSMDLGRIQNVRDFVNHLKRLNLLDAEVQAAKEWQMDYEEFKARLESIKDAIRSGGAGISAHETWNGVKQVAFEMETERTARITGERAAPPPILPLNSADRKQVENWIGNLEPNLKGTADLPSMDIHAFSKGLGFPLEAVSPWLQAYYDKVQILAAATLWDARENDRGLSAPQAVEALKADMVALLGWSTSANPFPRSALMRRYYPRTAATTYEKAWTVLMEQLSYAYSLDYFSKDSNPQKVALAIGLDRFKFAEIEPIEAALQFPSLRFERNYAKADLDQLDAIDRRRAQELKKQIAALQEQLDKAVRVRDRIDESSVRLNQKDVSRLWELFYNEVLATRSANPGLKYGYQVYPAAWANVVRKHQWEAALPFAATEVTDDAIARRAAATIPWMVPVAAWFFGKDPVKDRGILIQKYAPILETLSIGILFAATTVVLSALGMDVTFAQTLGLFTGLNIGFGFLHTSIYRRHTLKDPATGQITVDWRLEKADIPTRIHMSVNAIFIHAPLLLPYTAVLNPLAFYVLTALGYASSIGLHILGNSAFPPRDPRLFLGKAPIETRTDPIPDLVHKALLSNLLGGPAQRLRFNLSNLSLPEDWRGDFDSDGLKGLINRGSPLPEGILETIVESAAKDSATVQFYKESDPATVRGEIMKGSGVQTARQNSGTLYISLAGYRTWTEEQKDSMGAYLVGVAAGLLQKEGTPIVIVTDDAKQTVPVNDLFNDRDLLYLSPDVLPGLIRWNAEGTPQVDMNVVRSWTDRPEIKQRNLVVDGAQLIVKDENAVLNADGFLLIPLVKLIEAISNEVEMVRRLLTQA